MSSSNANLPWYSGITGYQWLVLTIASLGWIFDVFEGQVFVASMNEAMPSLLPTGTPEATSKLYNNIALGAFLAGGALGDVQPSAAARSLSLAIGRYWTRFAASGDPNGSGDPTWPLYDAAREPFLTLDATIESGSGLRTTQCDFCDGLSP